MMNHAAWVNGKRAENRVKRDKPSSGTPHNHSGLNPNGQVWRGKALSEMNTDEMLLYYGGKD